MSSESLEPMQPKAEWAIDSGAIRARGIIIIIVTTNGLKHRA